MLQLKQNKCLSYTTYLNYQIPISIHESHIFKRKEKDTYLQSACYDRYLPGPHSCHMHRLCIPDGLHQAMHPGIPTSQQEELVHNPRFGKWSTNRKQ
ncbi:hypothetical protein OIU76_017654 [Salix suchowensis]|nr:hypothetical protein OIU76_017654 [Salix suchowensis]